MTINQLSVQPPFTTKDGSTIRSILDRTNAPVGNIRNIMPGILKEHNAWHLKGT